MKKYLFIFFLVFVHNFTYAQFNHVTHKVELVNGKYISHNEALGVAKVVGDMSSEQTEKLYIKLLQINRNVNSDTLSRNFVHKNNKIFFGYEKEKEAACKKILTPKQYEILRENLKRAEPAIIEQYKNADEGIDFDNNSDTLSKSIFSK